MLKTSRARCALASLIAFSLCALAYFLEYYYQLASCPLCLLQRGIFIFIGLLFLIGTFKPYFSNIIFQNTLFFSVLGMIIAGRQIWLQHQPFKPGLSCSAGLESLLTVYSPFKALKIFFENSSHCYEIDFQILTLSLAEWSGLCFLGFALFSILALLYPKKGLSKK